MKTSVRSLARAAVYYAPDVTGLAKKVSGRNQYLIKLAVLAAVGMVIFLHISVSYVPEATYQRLRDAWQSREVLLASIRAEPASLEAIKDGSLFNQSSKADWRVAFPLEDEPFGSSIPPKNVRTRVYTYFDDDERGSTNLEEDWMNKNLIIAWQRAIYAAGFHPVILDPSNAEAHPQFKNFKNRNISDAEILNAKKYFALAHKGGEILWDFNLVPVKNHHEDSFMDSLINTKQFGKPAAFKEYGNRLVYSKLSHINSALEALSKMGGISLAEFENKFIKQDLPANDVIADYSKENVAKILNLSSPDLVSTERIIHLIGMHMHQKFIARYPNGLLVLEPSLEHSSILTAPAIQLAERLSVCPKQLSCPPTKTVLDELDRIDKLSKSSQGADEIKFDPYKFCTPCTKDIPILTSTTLEDTHKVFTIGMIPNPMTLLAIQEGTASLSSAIVRSRSESDIWTRAVTASYIPNETVGLSMRLLLLKDTMVDDPFVSNVSWHNWEHYTMSDKLNMEEPIEWQFGFELPDVIANYQDSVPDITDKSDFSELHLAQVLIEVKKYINEGAKNKAYVAVSNLSNADAEIWAFLMNLQSYEASNLKSLAN